MKMFTALLAALFAVVLAFFVRIGVNACLLMVVAHYVLPWEGLNIPLTWHEAFTYGVALLLVGGCIQSWSSK